MTSLILPKKEIYIPSKKSKLVWKSAKYSKYLFLEGAVRSSKSYTANFYSIDYIQSLPPCDILISGYTITSVARNVIAEWKKIIDPHNLGLFKMKKDGKDEFLSINWRGLKNKKFYIRGAGTAADWEQIQGATFGFWYCDEATRHHESFIDMAMSRLSKSYSKSVWTMNPDNPFHFVKKRFIDHETAYNKDSKDYSLYQKFHYVLRDNPSLTDETIAEFESMWEGVFYKRFILGLWALAEGLIYPFYNDDTQTYNHNDFKAFQYDIGGDYGQSNATTFELVGSNHIVLPGQPTCWVHDEFYYSGRDKGIIKTDYEYSIDLLKFSSKYTSMYDPIIEKEIGLDKLFDLKSLREDDKPINSVFLDPSAKSFITQLRKLGILNVKEADNSVIDGIRTVQVMLKKFQIMIHERCKNTRMELQSYSYDPKKQLLGIDAPLKENDHCMDALRYIIYNKFGLNSINYNKFLQR